MDGQVTALRRLDIPFADRTMPRMLARKAAQNGDKPYLKFEDSVYSYADADRLSNRLANGMAEHGIGKGDHIALILDNRPEMLWLYFAAGKLGAVSVPVNTASRGHLLSHLLDQSDATTVIVQQEHLSKLTDVLEDCPKLSRLVVLGRQGAIPAGLPKTIEAIEFQALDQADETPPGVDVHFSDVFALLYTSGTTGPSKGNISPHAHGLSYAIDRVEALGYRPEDVLYTCLPLFHGNALYGTCMPALVADATVVVSRRFSASGFWDEVRRYGVTQFNLLGAMTNFLWNQPASPGDRDHSVRQCTIVPAPPFAAEFEARFGIKITSVYALSDFGLATILPPHHPPEKLNTAGRPNPNVEVAILDDHDMPLPTGEVGEICLRSRLPWTIGQGYYNMPDATLLANRNQWFHTGDRGFLDPDGYLHFADRKKDAIRRRGENISSWEVEQIVLKHPDVLEVAAFAVSSEMSEDEVMVSLVLRDGAAPDASGLVRFCEQNMAYFMVPRYLEFVQALPRTETQKVEKFRLRADAERRLHEVWDREKAGIRISR